MMLTPLSQKFYLRIWFAVVGMLVFLSICISYAWHIHLENEKNNASSNLNLPSREIYIQNEKSIVIAHGYSKPGRRFGSPLEFELEMPTGETWKVIVPPRPVLTASEAGAFTAQHARGEDSFKGAPLPMDFARPMRPPGPPPGVWDWRWLPRWLQPPYSIVWLIVVLSIAVALGAYPVARRLTQRLEKLQTGVKKWGDGDLSLRVHVHGEDEVAYLAEQFNASAERIQNLIEAQKSLLANASHELRSPLARLRLALEMSGQSEQKSLDQEKRQKEIEKNIQELDQLIEEILLASKLDAEKSGKNVDWGKLEAVDMIGLCAEECARLDAQLELQQGLTFCEVQGRPKLLTRLIRNLLENAKRYSHGEIQLLMETVKGEKTELKIRVMDHGPGVPLSSRERIFEPFYRLPGASEKSGGVGLGLALVQSIAQQHGGSVMCEDRPDGQPGACFTVILSAA